MRRMESKIRIVKLVSFVILGVCAIAGIVFLAARYLEILSRPYYTLKRGRELSADACAFAEDDTY